MCFGVICYQIITGEKKHIVIYDPFLTDFQTIFTANAQLYLYQSILIEKCVLSGYMNL